MDEVYADLKSSGRSKRNIPLPIFKNEPMGRNNEFTYKELGYALYTI